jgi:hypothetical protein
VGEVNMYLLLPPLYSSKFVRTADCFDYRAEILQSRYAISLCGFPNSFGHEVCYVAVEDAGDYELFP